MPVAYTNHIGHSSRDTHSGKDTSVSTLASLAAVEKHNNHDYTAEEVARMQSDINLDLKRLNRHYVLEDGELLEVEGYLDLAANVRKIYEVEFGGAVEEYNLKQLESGHIERQISDYLAKISEDKQQEVVVEGLIQIGSLEDWQDVSLDDKLKIVPILERTLLETLSELDKGNSRFVLAGASLHLNEGSPHIHYVGVPVQELQEAKRGLRKRVKKSAVFTKDSLGTGLQDNVRSKIEPLIEKTYGWTFEAKKTGRNEDRDKRTQVNEILQQRIDEKNQELERIQEAIHDQELVMKDQGAAIEQSRKELTNLQQQQSDLQGRCNTLTNAENSTRERIRELEKREKQLQTYEEYTEKADEIEDKVSKIDLLLANLQNASKFFRQKAAEEFIDEIKKTIGDLFDWIKVAFSRVEHYEEKTRMSNERRRSPSLDERIKQSERKVRRGYEQSREDSPAGSSSDDGPGGR